MKKLDVDIILLIKDKKNINYINSSINKVIKELKGIVTNQELQPSAFYRAFNDGLGIDNENSSLSWINSNDMPECINKIQGISEKIQSYIDRIRETDSSETYTEEPLPSILPLPPKPESVLPDIIDGNIYNPATTNPKVEEVNKDKNVVDITSPIYVYTNEGSVKIESGKYDVKEYIYDINGKPVAAVIEYNGKLITLQIINGMVVGLDEDEKSFTLTKPIDITLSNGQKYSFDAKEYKLVDVIILENGKIYVIEQDGIKALIYVDNNGNITKIEYIEIINGVFTINNKEFNIYDKYGNIITKYSSGQYYIYEVKYDVEGNVIALRLSPDGEYELWVYLDKEDNNSYQLFKERVDNSKGGSLSMFAENKNLFGVLGLLIVSLAGTLIVKKKLKKKNEENDFYEEEPLPEGNYAVYEVKKNDEGIITDARITPDDYNEEYWVEM